MTFQLDMQVPHFEVISSRSNVNVQVHPKRGQTSERASVTNISLQPCRHTVHKSSSSPEFALNGLVRIMSSVAVPMFLQKTPLPSASVNFDFDFLFSIIAASFYIFKLSPYIILIFFPHLAVPLYVQFPLFAFCMFPLLTSA
ncbi:unnamed protein product [Umbelopsis ramanniana]